MPMDYDGLRGEDESERTDNVTDYKRTCIDFIEDISGSYLEWVDYYKLPEDEDKKRRKEIASIIERTNTWLAKIPQSTVGCSIRFVCTEDFKIMSRVSPGIRV